MQTKAMLQLTATKLEMAITQQEKASAPILGYISQGPVPDGI